MGFLHSQLFVTPPYPTASCVEQTVVVTGSDTGLGKEAVRDFARLGASKVIIACRNNKVGEEAKKDIESSTQCDADILEVWPLDLLPYDSCRAFADRASKLPRIDVFLKNAGIAGFDSQVVGGHERMVAVNVIGTFFLAMLMLPKLKAFAVEHSTMPRLIIVSSEVHSFSKFPERKKPNRFKTLNNKSKARTDERYPTSKLPGVLAIRQIAPQLQGSGVIFN